MYKKQKFNEINRELIETMLISKSNYDVIYDNLASSLSQLPYPYYLQWRLALISLGMAINYIDETISILDDYDKWINNFQEEQDEI